MGSLSPAERRRLRSLRCGPRSKTLLGRSPGEVRSVSVERRSSRAPHTPWLWRRCSVPQGGRTAATPPFSPSLQHCGGVQLPEPCGRSGAHVLAWHAAAALVVSGRRHQLVVARWDQPSLCNTEKRQSSRDLSEPGGGGADRCVLTRSLSITLNKCT